MDITELKMVLDTLASLGVAGKEAFIWWLMFDKMLPTLVGMLAIVLLYQVIKHIAHAMSSSTDLETIRDSLKIGRPGVVTSDELAAVKRKVVELKVYYDTHTRLNDEEE